MYVIRVYTVSATQTYDLRLKTGEKKNKSRQIKKPVSKAGRFYYKGHHGTDDLRKRPLFNDDRISLEHLTNGCLSL